MTEENKEVTYEKLSDALNHMQNLQFGANKSLAIYAENFKKFTGFDFNRQLTAFEVVSLMYKFYGEPTNVQIESP